MRTTHTRPGFTLVEILIVISLIAILTAISAGVFFRIKGSQEGTTTDSTLQKIDRNLMARWSVVLDDARKSLPTGLIEQCGNDKDRALVVWSLAKLRNEFPETKAEATTPISLPGAPVLRPRQVFVKLATELTNAGVAVNSPEVSAAFLYAALSQTGGGGNVVGDEGLRSQAITAAESNSEQFTTQGVTTFRDAWGLPIRFVRHARTTEINNPPYTRPNPVRVGNNTIQVFASLDPLGKMIELPANDPYRATFAPILGQPLTFFNNQNALPTLISAGPNQDFGTDPLSLTEDAALDNVLSFRLRREGAKGD